MIRTKLASLGVGVTIAVALAGCGTAPSGDEADVVHTVEQFMTAFRTGDGETVCGLSLRNGEVVTSADAGWQECVDSVPKLASVMAERYKEAGITSTTVKKATVSGDTATVSASDITGDVFFGEHAVLQLTKIDGTWYLDSPGE